MARLGLILLTSMLLSGCSFLFHQPVRQPSRDNYVEICTETYAAPIVDTVIASVLALSGFAFAILNDQIDDKRGDRERVPDRPTARDPLGDALGGRRESVGGARLHRGR